MRNNIVEILQQLGNGEKPFYEQDVLPKEMQLECLEIVKNEKDLGKLNSFFQLQIAPIIFHSKNMYRAYAS